MGKGNRNRRLSLQNEAEDRYNHPEKYAKKSGNKNKGGNGIPAWGGKLAVVVIAVILVASLVLIGLQNTAVLLRSRTVLETEHYEVDGAMMQYFFRYQYQQQIQTYSQYLSFMSVSQLAQYGLIPNTAYAFDDEVNNVYKNAPVLKDDNGKELKDADGNKMYDSEAISLRGGKTYTWWDYLMDAALKQAKQTLVYCESAYAENYTSLESLNPEAVEEINETIKDLKATAKSAGYSLNAYVANLYGAGISAKDVRKCLEISYIASEYASLKNEEFEAAITDKDIDDKYAADTKNYLFADYLNLDLSITFDEIKADYLDTLENEDKDVTTEDNKKAVERAEIRFTKVRDALKKIAAAINDDSDEAAIKEAIYEAFAYHYYFEITTSKTGDYTFSEEEMEKVVANALFQMSEGKEGGDVEKDSNSPIADRVFNRVYNESKAMLKEEIALKDITNPDVAKWLFEATNHMIGDIFVAVDDSVEGNTNVSYPEATYPESDEEEEDVKDEEEETEEDKAEDKEEDKKDEEDDGTKSEFDGQSYSLSILYLTSVPARNENASVDVGYIVIGADHEHSESGEHVEPKDDAEALLKAFLAGGNITIEAFEEFAKKTENVRDGYTVIEDYLKGDLGEDAFDDWAYDEELEMKTGEVIEIQSGGEVSYYLVAVCFGEGEPIWKVQVKNDIADEKFEEFDKQITETYEKTITVSASAAGMIK